MKGTTRREFLKQTGAAAAGLAVAGCTSPKPAGAKTERHLIDTHTHFYDPARPEGVPWPRPEDKLLYRTVLPEHYRALPTPEPVTGTVVVEASPWVEDNQWVLDLAKYNPFIVGLVGNLPVGTEDFKKHLKRFAGDPLFRGLRLNQSRLRDGLKQEQFLADLRLLAEKDLSLDLLVSTAALPDAATLADKIPDLRIIIDHVANVKIDGRAPDPAWRGGMRRASGHRNVYCKVSGLVEGTGKTDGTAPRDVEFYRPVLDTVWELFGEDRLIYGSNWPVSERFASLETVQGIVTDYFSAKGTVATEKYFWRNAGVFYKWVKRSA